MSSSLFYLQGKAPKEIHAILTETLACFLPGRVKDLSAHQVLFSIITNKCTINNNIKIINNNTILHWLNAIRNKKLVEQ